MKSSRSSIIVIDSFYPQAQKLRNYFETCFSNPRKVHPKRFVWDYWNIPNQYTLLRTPAYEFFPQQIYKSFHQALVKWGRNNLGCHDISPPWLSCYVDGCHQNFHGDLPHGPWAYVFSLTPKSNKNYTGGETVLLKDEILSYWDSQPQFKGLEQEDLFIKVKPHFNQLTIFDPRIPHSVATVKGPQNVCEGRLVIHGWFVEPRPFIEGPLSRPDLQKAIGFMSTFLGDFMKQITMDGVMSLSFKVGANGKNSQIKVLTNTLRSPEPESIDFIFNALAHFWSEYPFPKQKGQSKVTLPVIFHST